MEKDTRYELLDKASISADQISRPSVSYWKDAWRRFRKATLAMFGLVMILIVSLFAIFGPMLCPYDYDEADFLSIAQWPSKAHWFGTDALGRDLYVRVLYGARISLSIGVVAALVNMVIGSFGVLIQVMMLTSGSPRGTTSVLQYLLYDKSFNLFQFGQGAAIGMITALLVLLTTVVLNQVFHTEGGKAE